MAFCLDLDWGRQSAALRLDFAPAADKNTNKDSLNVAQGQRFCPDLGVGGFALTVSITIARAHCWGRWSSALTPLFSVVWL